jgi:glutamate 5-kinase
MASLTKEQMKNIVSIVNSNDSTDFNELTNHYNSLLGCDVSYLEGDDFLLQLLDKIMLFLILERKNMSEKTLENVLGYIKENLQ